MSCGYWDSVEHHVGQEFLEGFWMAHPAVRERINIRVSGEPGCWPTTWFRRRFAGRLPFRNALSIGCGTGNLERDLVRQEIALRVTGIDVVSGPLELARAVAAEEGMADAISYIQADAREHLRAAPAGETDAVFFHGSLHHFDRLRELLELVRRVLVPGGILYLDEYVGPSMREWGPRLLLLPNVLYYLLPKSLRRPRLVRTPINPEDPTEAICAGEILDAVDHAFDVVERRDYGGDLLALIYPNLRRPGQGPGAPSPEELDEAVRFLLDCEELLLRYPRITRSRPYHTVLVATPRE